MEIRNPKPEIRNNLKYQIAQCLKPSRALWFWALPRAVLNISDFGIRICFGFQVSAFGFALLTYPVGFCRLLSS
jgi:hypothetical protein